MITYRIGAPAEKIIAIRICPGGKITPILRRRTADGALDRSAEHNCGSAHLVTDAEFTVFVEPGHSGVVEIRPDGSGAALRTIIPLGVDRPFLDSEFPMSPGTNGAYSQSTGIKFHFKAGALHWMTETMSGCVDLDPGPSSVSIALRLPPDNDGAMVFSLPLFPQTDGRYTCRLSV